MATHSHPAGSYISYDADGTPPYTDLAEIISIDAPEVAREPSVDTKLESTDKIKITTPGMKDPGESGFVVYMTKTQVATLIGFYNSGTTYYWKITFPLIDSESTASILVWQGWVMSYKAEQVEAESNDKWRVNFRIKNTTMPVFTAGS